MDARGLREALLPHDEEAPPPPAPPPAPARSLWGSPRRGSVPPQPQLPQPRARDSFLSPGGTGPVMCAFHFHGGAACAPPARYQLAPRCVSGAKKQCTC
jgi:hypothetical protein